MGVGLRALILLALATLVSWPAAAAPAADSAEAALRRGVRLLAERKDAEARAELGRAYALEPTPEAAGQLGFAESALGLWALAEGHLGEALAAEKDPWVERNRAPLEQKLRATREHLGTLVVTGSPEGAALTVAGQLVGRLPLVRPLRLAVGPAEVAAAAPGHAAETRKVTIEPGVVQRIAFALAPLEAGGTSVVTAPPLAEAAVTGRPAEGARRFVRLLGFACVAAGAAGVTVGALWARGQPEGAYGGKLLAWSAAGLLVGGAADLALAFTVLAPREGRGVGLALVLRR
jgi:hypothetical protein